MDTAINTMPTGFEGEAPPGPAIPVMPIPMSVCPNCLTFFASRSAVSLDTAPCCFNTSAGMLSSLIFVSLAYAIIPKVKYFELPGIFVRESATRPPVHDSANASVSLFFVRMRATELSIMA